MSPFTTHQPAGRRARVNERLFFIKRSLIERNNSRAGGGGGGSGRLCGAGLQPRTPGTARHGAAPPPGHRAAPGGCRMVDGTPVFLAGGVPKGLEPDASPSLDGLPGFPPVACGDLESGAPERVKFGEGGGGVRM